MNSFLNYRFFFPILLVLIGTSASLFGQDIENYVVSLQRLSAVWAETEAEFETISNENDIQTTNRIATNEDASIVRSFQSKSYKIPTGIMRTQKTWRYLTNEIRFTRNLTIHEGRDEDIDNCTARLKSEPYFKIAFQPVQCFYGVDIRSGEYWHRILSDKKGSISIKATDNISKVTVENPVYGRFVFSFIDGDQPILTSVTFRANAGKGEQSSGGSTLIGYDVSKISFKHVDDEYFMQSINLELHSTLSHIGRAAEQKKAALAQKLLSVRPLNKTLTKKIQFADIEIENGQPVRVHDDSDIPYEFHNGQIVRVVDKDNLVASASARFRKPGGFGIWCYAPLCAWSH
jgi:hypothetical protein